MHVELADQYRAGTVSYLNVVTAQASALGTERSSLDVRNRQLNAVNQLLKNLAGPWEETTSQIGLQTNGIQR